MIFFMLTNIVAESSELLCAGTGAREKMISRELIQRKSGDDRAKGLGVQKESTCTDTGFGTEL